MISDLAQLGAGYRLYIKYYMVLLITYLKYLESLPFSVLLVLIRSSLQEKGLLVTIQATASIIPPIQLTKLAQRLIDLYFHQHLTCIPHHFSV